MTGAIKERREQFRPEYARGNVVGTSLCVAAVLPLFMGI